MRVFLTLVAKQGRLSPDALVRVPRLAAVALPFRDVPYRSDGWVSPAVSVAIFAWDNDVQGTIGLELIHRDEGVATWTHSGHVSHPEIGDSRNSAEVACAISATYPSPPQLGGAFAVLRADARDAKVEVWNAVTRLVPVYWGETGEAFVVTNRALLLSFILAGGTQPEYEPGRFFPFMSRGYFANEQTPFRGVHVMPADTLLSMTSGGVRSTPLSDAARRYDIVRPSERLYDELAARLCQNVASFRGRNIRCSLTGGKDSRLVAAALHKAGVTFSTRTKGFAGHPDVVIASRIAGVLGVPHVCKPPQTEERDGQRVIEVDLREQANRAIFAMDGMVSAFYGADYSPPSPVFRQRVEMGGGGGESLRGGFARALNLEHSLERADVERFIRRTFFSTSWMFAPAAVKAQRTFFSNWLDNEITTSSPAVALDRLYLLYRTGRWASAAQAALVDRISHQPLFDNALTKAAMNIDGQDRLQECLMFNLLLRLAPDLVDIPFVKTRWKFEEHGPRPGDDDGWRRRTPLELHRHQPETFDWRFACGTDLRHDLYEQILLDPRADAIFEVVRRDELHRVLEADGRVEPSTPMVLMLWGIYSASVLLSNSWISGTDEGHVTAVVVPSR